MVLIFPNKYWSLNSECPEKRYHLGKRREVRRGRNFNFKTLVTKFCSLRQFFIIIVQRSSTHIAYNIIQYLWHTDDKSKENQHFDVEIRSCYFGIHLGRNNATRIILCLCSQFLQLMFCGTQRILSKLTSYYPVLFDYSEVCDNRKNVQHGVIRFFISPYHKYFFPTPFLVLKYDRYITDQYNNRKY